MMTMALVQKGRGEPRDGLAQQGKVHVGLAKQYADALAEHGWSSDDTIALEKNVASLESSMAAQVEARIEAGGATKSEASAVDDAKRFIRRLRNALPRAIRGAKNPAITMATFASGEALARSTPRIVAYLIKIRPAVEALDSVLEAAFGGQKASSALDTVRGALSAADTAQEIARSNVPEQTLSLYEMKGRVLEQIEDLNRAAKSAFDGQAAIVAKFNKDVLLRARKTRAKKNPEIPAAAPPKDASTPEASPVG